MEMRSRSSFFLCYELKIHLMFHTHDPRVLILVRMHRISTNVEERELYCADGITTFFLTVLVGGIGLDSC